MLSPLLPSPSLAGNWSSTASHCRLRPPEINTFSFGQWDCGKHGVSGSLKSTCRLRYIPLEPSFLEPSHQSLRKPKKPQEGEPRSQPTIPSWPPTREQHWPQLSERDISGLAIPESPSQPTESWGITDSTVVAWSYYVLKLFVLQQQINPINILPISILAESQFYSVYSVLSLKNTYLCSLPFQRKAAMWYNFDQ